MKYAETWLDVGRLPLRRRDVNAMRLALECLRWYPRGPEASDALRDASDALRLPMWEVGVRTAIGAALGEAVEQAWQDDHSCRLFRARLALLLRVLLRVDARDYGPHRDVWCDQEHLPCFGDLHRHYAKARPLWEAA